MASIFLSHSSRDNGVAEFLRGHLKSRGYGSLFLDFDPEIGIAAGNNWERELYRKLKASDAVIALCSESSMDSRWCFAEIAQARALGIPIFPIKIDTCSVDGILSDRQVVDIAAEGVSGYARLWDGLQKAGLDPRDSIHWDATRPPYPGLNVFREDDAGVFFGREEKVREVLGLLTQLRTKGAARLAMVVGSSGSGKSSLVRAGVIPRLKKDREFWRVVPPFRPGRSPIRSLAKALAAAQSTEGPALDLSEIRQRLLPGDAKAAQELVKLAEQMAASGRPGEAAVLLVVDQWEELLGPEVSEVAKGERDAFHALLREALEDPGSPLFVLATIRSDFFEAFQVHSAWPGLDPKIIDLKPMPPEQFPRIVEGPADRAGLTFEYGLTTRLVRDAGDAGALPLLAFTLRELFERSKGLDKITFDTYEKQVGGIRGAISHAVGKSIGAELTGKAEAPLRRAFVNHLVRVDEQGRYLRREARWDDLPEEARPLLEEFISSRLLTTRGDGPNRTVEVVHETFFVAWDRLKDWLEKSHELLLWRRGIEEARVAWERSPPDQRPGFLLTGARVTEARRWLSIEAGDLQPSEREFLLTSVAAEDDRHCRERDQQEERIRLARNRALIAYVAAFLALLALVVAILAIRSDRNFRQADRDRQEEKKGHRITKLAETRLLQDASLGSERMSDYGASAVLLGKSLKEAYGLDRHLDDEIRVAIALAQSRLLPLENILEVSGLLRKCAVSPDGKFAVVGSDKGRIWYVDLERSELATGAIGEPGGFSHFGDHPELDAVTGMSFAPGKSIVAIPTNRGVIHLIDTVTGKRRTIDHASPSFSAGFSPDGTRIVVAGRRGNKKGDSNPSTLVIYDVESGTCIRRFPVNEDLLDAAFSPDGRWIAAGGGIMPDSRLTLWDLNQPDAPPHFLPQLARVFTLAFRPGDRAKSGESRLITGDANGKIRFWKLVRDKTGGTDRVKEIWENDGPEIQHDKQVRITSFSEDGRLLLVGGEDNSARVWDVETRFPVGQRLEHRGEVRAGAISLKAGRIVTADFAGDIRVWRLPPPASTGWVYPHPGPVWDATFNRAGDRVLTACPNSNDAEGAGRIWSLSNEKPVYLPQGTDVMVARFRPPSDEEAVTCGNDGTVFFWDVRTGEKFGKPLSHEKQLVYSAAFDSTGNVFAFAGRGQPIRIFDYEPSTREFRPREAIKHPVFSHVWNLQFGPKEGQLFSDGGFPVRVWDLRPAGRPVHDLFLKEETVNIDNKVEVRFGGVDRLGRLVLVHGMDGGIRVWDTENPKEPPRSLGNKPHGTGRIYADWHGGKDVIATGGPDGVVRFWKPDGSRWSAQDLRHPSAIEALSFSSDGRWLATGCRDGGLRIWSVAENGSGWTGAGWYHAGPVTRVQFSGDGRHLLSASRDGTARVVPVPRPKLGDPDAILAELQADAGILIDFGRTETTSSVTAPQPLSAETFKQQRKSAEILRNSREGFR